MNSKKLGKDLRNLKKMRVALVYDRVNKWGGAERVLLALHKIFPKAPLYTSVYNPQKAKWAKKFTVKTSFLQGIPFAKDHHQLFALLMPLAFGNFRFDAFDVVLSITSESAKAVQVKGDVRHICLCLTPTRYLWSGYEEYFPNTTIRHLTKPIIDALKFLDKKTAQNPHKYIAISKEVQKRIKTYYGRESSVLYPPLMLHEPKGIKGPTVPKGKTFGSSGSYGFFGTFKKKGYFLVVSRLSRLTPYKRIDIAIKAAIKAGVPLVVVGEGNQKYYQKFADSTVKFINNVTDKKLIKYYKNAKALIFPGREDFGLAMVESLSCGTPVIAYKAGGALEIVQEGVTGKFFKQPTVNSLSRVLKNFDETDYNSQSCRESAKRFSFSYFEKSLKKYILHVI